MTTNQQVSVSAEHPGQARPDAPVRPPPLHTHNHTLPAGLSRRSRLIRLLHARVLRNHWGAWCFLAAGLTVTVLTSLYIKTSVESAAQREFDFACNEIRLKIEARLEAGAQILRSGAALFDASETVSRGGWRTFAQRLQIEQHLPGIQGIGFAALIPRAQLDQHVQAIRSEGFPDYQVWPAGERESYSAIVYLEPFEGRNQRAFGYDMLSEPVRRAAMERARDENAAALSGKVRLMQETGQDVQAGGLLYVPVYRHGLPIETIEQRRAALQGWVYSPYRMTDLMRGTLGHWDVKQKGKQISLQVYDGDVLSADTLLYDSQGATDRAPASTALIARLTPVDFAGRRWTLRFTEPGGLVSLVDYGKAWLVLFGGTMGTLLLFGLMLWRQQRIRIYREKAEAGAVLRASELRYRRLFEAARDGVLILDAETGMVVDVNPYLIDLLGVTRDVFLSKRVWELGFFTDLIANEANFVELQQKGYVRYEDMAMEGHDGKRHEVEFVSNVYLVNHQKVIQCNIRDISERVRAAAALRESEDNYRLLFREMQNGFALHEIIRDEAGNPSDYRFLAVNPAFERMTGLKAAETVGRTVSEILPDTERSWIEHYGKVALTGVPVCFENYAASMKKHFEVVAFRPKIKQFACVFSDITERKHAEAEHEKLQIQFAQAQKMESVGRLAGGVAHDFNNLLMGMMGYVQLCRDKIAPDHPIQEYLAEIMHEAERSAEITRQLLAFARKQTIAPRVMDLNEAVDSMLKLLRRLIGEDIHLAWRPGVDLRPVRIDPSQIDQILANLCVNARDAIAGVGEVTLETGSIAIDAEYCAKHPEAIPGAYVFLDVTDNGCGMDSATLAQVFEPFFTTKGLGKGTGLGLATVYGIVKQNNGFIYAYSEPGKGTTFKIYLPEIAAETVAATVTRKAEAPRGRGETILLVEDEKSLRVTCGAFLDPLGYNVMVAETPGEALKMVAGHPGDIHVLLTDVVMPGMDGRQLAKRISAVKPGVKVLFMSGYTSDVIAQRGVLDEGVQFLSKPFTRDDLARKLREILEGPRPG